MIDEDAFGVLLGYYRVEDDEYGIDERSEFAARFQRFEHEALAALSGMYLPSDHHVLSLGHAVYAELANGDDTPGLLAEFRRACARLDAAGFENVGVLSHGSRWVRDGELPDLSVETGPPRVARISAPSEPLRKALAVEAFCRPDDALASWGPGTYVDLEALDALGKKPKNAPTELCAGGARFYRIPPIVLD